MNDIIRLLATTKPNYVDSTSGTSTTAPTKGLDDNVTAIINAVIGVLGIVAVVMIIIGGVNYMTSAGDAGKVKTAKNTILYGVIGLVIVVLAFAIVNFVIKGILGQQ